MRFKIAIKGALPLGPEPFSGGLGERGGEKRNNFRGEGDFHKNREIFYI